MKQLLNLKKLCMLAVALTALLGCKEHVDTSARYVFKEETIMSYLQKHPVYSEYVDLLNVVPMSKLSESKVGQLLSARGNYTVFAPTNDAIHAYLKTLVDEGLIADSTWDAFTDETKKDSIQKVIVYNSIIDGGDEVDNYYYTAEFPEIKGSEFALANLNDKKLSVWYIDNEPDSIYINKDCPISVTERDILNINGIIHQMGKVIAPKDITAASYIQEALDEQRDGYLTCFRVIQACGLLDTLSKIRDEHYEDLYQAGKIEDLNGMTSYGFAEGSIGYAPKHRLYGFTIFAETDDYWREQGIDPRDPDLLKKLVQWIQDNHQYSDDDVFTTDEDYTSEKNLLYQWITYHILPMRIPADKLVFHINEYNYTQSNPYKYTVPVMEYYTTLGQRRLFKLYQSAMSDGVWINRFANIDHDMNGSGMEVSCDADKEGAKVLNEADNAIVNDITNCCIYPITAPISYNDDVRDNLQKTRIRFDGMSLFPEAMNNDLRLKKATDERYKHVYIPNSVTSYDYFPNMQQNDEMNFVYYNAWNDSWCNLNCDEMKAVGRFEIMFKLPPVPRRGTYELRYKVLANGNRGIGQIYFGSDPENLPVAGIPIDLTMKSTDRKTGWYDGVDFTDEEAASNLDKTLRNNGFMRGSKNIWDYGDTERGDKNSSRRENVRRIIVRQTLDPSKTYYLKIKSVLDSDRKEFYMDYLEFCAKEVYDNPETPEDIW